LDGAARALTDRGQVKPCRLVHRYVSVLLALSIRGADGTLVLRFGVTSHSEGVLLILGGPLAQFVRLGNALYIPIVDHAARYILFL